MFWIRTFLSELHTWQCPGILVARVPAGSAWTSYFCLMAFKDDSNRVGVALLVLRVTIFLVMLVWTIDKFVEPQHASKIMEHFYFIKGVGNSIIYIIGAIELAILG